MADRREQILVRLLAIVGGIAGVKTPARNLDEINAIARPAIIVLDADEAALETADRHAGNATVIVTMIPEIRILIGTKVADVGHDLNQLRAAVLKAVTADADLQALIGRNGRAKYLGLGTALGHGRTMDGDMLLRFGFTYPLIISEL